LVSRFKLPDESIPKDAAYQVINDELMLDGNPRLNLASFVTTWMEPECDKLIMAALNKNYVDMDEYPVTTELQVAFCHFFQLVIIGQNLQYIWVWRVELLVLDTSRALTQM
jgi:glutamate/tyrosine decarboxylase-like PLP-dependent enzyme